MRTLKMKVREIFVKSIISKSRIYGIDYSVNPYLGCQHGCKYCYARFMLRFVDEKDKWGEFVHVKVNAPRLFSKEISRVRDSSILFSSVCDPYQPLEERYELMRPMLKKLIDREDIHTIILTKSDLVLRDVDILSKMKNLEVGFTINFYDDSYRKVFEPGAPPIRRRFRALRKLKENGIRTFGFIAPFLPIFTYRDLERLLKEYFKSGVDYIFLDKLRVKHGNYEPLSETLRNEFPEHFEDFFRKTFSNSYFMKIKREVESLCLDYPLHCVFGY